MSSIAALRGEARPLDLASLVRTASALLLRRPWLYGGGAAVLTAWSVLSVILFHAPTAGVMAATDGRGLLMFLWITAMAVIRTSVWMLVFVPLSRVAICDLRGRPTSTADAMAAALFLLVPMTVMEGVRTVALTFAAVLLVVPALLLAAVWAIAAQVRIAEGGTIWRAFARSAALTRGRRREVLLLVVLYGLAAKSLSFFLTFRNMRGEFLPAQVMAGVGFLDSLIAAAALVIAAVGGAALYFALLGGDHARRTPGVADVFD